MSLLEQPNLVSTIIPVFNRPVLIVDAVESVIAQTHRPIEVLVVDDGSTDNTPTVLQQLAAKHPEVKIYSQPNSGPGVARECGRLNARGEYVQYLDSDDVLLPEKFERQVAALQSNSHADVAYGKTDLINVGSETEPRGEAARQTGIKHKAMFPYFIRERWWFTSTPLYRRRILERVGPWTTESNEEDWEYDCRVAALGGELAYTDTFVSLHRIHDSHLSEKGGTSPEKLADRAMSRAKIFQHAKRYMELESRSSEIDAEDWRFFSNYAFLLARQCALAGLTMEARAMLSVSIDAVDKKTPQHILFVKLVKVFGWQRAAKLVNWVRG